MILFRPVFSLISFMAFAIASLQADEKTVSGLLTFTTLNGEKVTPLVSENGKPAVVIFVTIDCPIANGYAPEFSRIHKKYAALGVKLTLVHVDPDLTDAAAKKHAGEYSLTAPIIIDREQKLVAATGATITPEAAIFNGKGELIYLGRINNRYATLGDRKNTVSEHNLRDAIDAALAGKTVAESRVEAVGCLMPEL